jgi:hypothetical protein
MLSDELLLRSQLPRVLYVNVYPYRLQGAHPEYLLFRRRKDVVLPGIWQPISGKIVTGQTISEAFAAQVEKKTGGPADRIDSVDYVNTYYDSHYDAVMLVPSAVARISERAIRLDADLHDEVCWVKYEEIPKAIPFAGQLEAYARVHATLGK